MLVAADRHTAVSQVWRLAVVAARQSVYRRVVWRLGVSWWEEAASSSENPSLSVSRWRLNTPSLT